MRFGNLSLGTKLSLALLAFLLLLAAAMSIVIVFGFNRTQDNARATSREGLEDFGSRALNSFVRLVAESTRLEFARAGESAQAGAGYMALFRTSGVPTWDGSRLIEGAGGMRYDPAPDRLADAWIPSFLANDVSAEARLQDASALDPLFPGLLENVPNGAAAYFIGDGGEGRYYPPNGVQDIVPPNFDLWTVPGFDEVRPDKNPERNVVWTVPYEDSAGQGLIVSAIAPVYIEEEFIGVVGFDISLSEFTATVDEISPSHNGYAFYVDKGGSLLPTTHAPDVEAALGLPEHESLTQAFDGMLAGETGATRTSIGSEDVFEDVFIVYAPIEGLGGSLGFVAPVQDIRDEAGAAAITAAIGDEGDRTLQITLVVVASLFVAGLAGATWLNRRLLVRPLQQLVSATHAVAAGDLGTTVALNRGDELGTLGGSFNEMVQQLRESERVLERRVEERTRELDALLRADGELFRSLDLDEVLRALVDVAVDLLGADKSLVTIWDRERGEAQLRASRNMSSESLELFKSALTRPGHGALPEDFDLVVHRDLPAPGTTLVEEQLVHEIAQREGIEVSVEIPVKSPTRGVLGGFGIGYTRAHEFSKDDERLFTALAERAAAAIENAELYKRAQQAASLEERQRLARELHDSVSQALYGIALGARTARTLLDQDPAKAAEPVDYVLSLAEAGLTEMRALIFELRPESLANEGVVAALEKQIASARARHGLDITFAACPEPDVPLDVKEAVYRIGQEALHNIVKHAKATHVDVALNNGVAGLELTITDDGVGFDPAGDFAGHLGLHSMRERAANVHGELTIESAPGSRAVVSFRLGS